MVLGVDSAGVKPVLGVWHGANENSFACTEEFTRRVERWRSGEMFLRWTGAALLFAEGGFRKVRGYRHLHQLSASLKNQIFDGGQIAA